MTRYYDISVEFQDGRDGQIRPHPEHSLPVYCGHKCTAFDLTVSSHHGTYYETSSHVFRDGRDTHEVPIEDFFLECAIVHLAGQGAITAAELTAAGGHVRPGDALPIHSPAKDRYFARDAVAWMVERGVKLLAADLPRYDTGFVNPTGMFIDLFRAEIPIIANLEGIERIPAERGRLIVLPLKVRGVGTVPCRAVVAVEDAPARRARKEHD